MRTIAKVGLVTGGYAAALLAAGLVIAVYVVATAGPDRQSYGGMYAFGDSVLFFAAFCVAGLPATGLWLYFLRASAWFWSGLSLLALGASGLSLFLLLCEMLRGPAAVLMLAPLWFLASPLPICGFGLAWVFAPERGARRALGWGAVIAAGSVGALFSWAMLTRV